MRLLFDLDMKNYGPEDRPYVRPSARCITIRDGLIAMVHSLKYDYYKFPGGGIEAGETFEEAMIRETKEEAGLVVIPESVREYGHVPRIEKTRSKNEYLVQENYYYICETTDELLPQVLDDYEDDERFTLEWVKPEAAIHTNLYSDHGPKVQTTFIRESKVLELLIKEGYFNTLSDTKEDNDMNTGIHTENAPAAIGPYSQAVLAGNTLYVSGQLPVDPSTGAFAGDDITAQTKQSLENIGAILKEAGFDFSNVVKTTVLLKNIGDFAAMNAVYADFFKAPYPARAAFQVAALPKDALVEIEAVAVR